MNVSSVLTVGFIFVVQMNIVCKFCFSKSYISIIRDSGQYLCVRTLCKREMWVVSISSDMIFQVIMGCLFVGIPVNHFVMIGFIVVHVCKRLNHFNKYHSSTRETWKAPTSHRSSRHPLGYITSWHIFRRNKIACNPWGGRRCSARGRRRDVIRSWFGSRRLSSVASGFF